MPSRRALLAAAALPLLARTARARTPEFPLFDAHVHFVSTDTATYKWLMSRDPAQQAARTRLHADPADVDANLQAWDANHVAAGLGIQYRTAYGTDNRYLLDCAAAHPHRIHPVVILDGADAATPARLAPLQRQGAVGLRLTGRTQTAANYDWLDAPPVLATYEAAHELKLPVELMYTPRKIWPDALARIKTIADTFPRLPLVLDHFGWPDAQGAPDFGLAPLEILRARPNVHFKFTTINLNALRDGAIPAALFLRHAADMFGADRIMWGSDRGNTPGPYAQAVSRAIASTAQLTSRERGLVLAGTSRAVWPTS